MGKKNKKNISPTMSKIVREFKKDLLEYIRLDSISIENKLLDSIEKYEKSIKDLLDEFIDITKRNDINSLRDLLDLPNEIDFRFTTYVLMVASISNAIRIYVIKRSEEFHKIFIRSFEEVYSNYKHLFSPNDKKLFVEKAGLECRAIFRKKVIKVALEFFVQISEDIVEDFFLNLANIIVLNIDSINFKVDETSIMDYDDIIDLVEKLFAFDENVKDKILNKLIEANTGNRELEKEIIIVVERNKRNKVYKYIGDWNELNSIAEQKGFTLTRCKGDHGIFNHKETNKMVVIPQNRRIGKGLSLKIQKRLDDDNNHYENIRLQSEKY
jgi:predicted RNA binding protein YcfA (HicA-like mRNA interferase family)